MPGSQNEVSNAIEEGVQFRFNVQPLEIVEDQGKATAVRVVETRLGLPDESGRQRPEPVEGSETLIHADAIIVAFGFQASPENWFDQFDIPDANRAAVGEVDLVSVRKSAQSELVVAAWQDDDLGKLHVGHRGREIAGPPRNR